MIADDMDVVREGVWLYQGCSPIKVRIVHSPEAWGTGDYEDDPEVAEGRDVPCFIVLYEGAGEPGRFSNIVPNLPTIDAATEFVERMFPGIVWS